MAGEAAAACHVEFINHASAPGENASFLFIHRDSVVVKVKNADVDFDV